VLRLRRPSPTRIEQLLSEARNAAPSYPDVGATRAGPLPTGYRHCEYATRLGEGQPVFERAVQALRGWRAQVDAGIEVIPRDAWVEDGETVVLLIRAAGLWATAPCRVVYVVDEPDVFTFAYATLAGHPESGEAAFAIRRDESGEVTFSVSSFSRPIDPLARLGAPLARRIQTRVNKRYLEALRKAVGYGKR
jgi:uncharacterized protein (UPF0548 family)